MGEWGGWGRQDIKDYTSNESICRKFQNRGIYKGGKRVHGFLGMGEAGAKGKESF